MIFIGCSILSVFVLNGQSKNPPNIIIIVADDLGFGDLRSYGHPFIKTPNLDRLAEEGMKMTECYASSPMCSPSRAGLLTGRIPYRTGVYDWIAPDSTMYLPKKEVTIASLLKKGGYQTASVGKWHLNGKFNVPEQPQPNDHGFDYWFGCQYSLKHLDPDGFFRNGEPVTTKGYAADIVADEAIDWLEHKRNFSQPFFQYIAFLEPHEPIFSPPGLTEQYVGHGKNAEYYANVANLDQAVGRIIKKLDDLNLSENTLVFFTSDNGPAQYTPNGYFNKSHGSAGPYKGYKRHMFEGGLRVPGIFRWKGTIVPGQTNETPMANTDLLPTICKLTGIKIPKYLKLDGTDIGPIFYNKEIKRKKALHWHFYDPWGGPQSLLREGDFILGAQWNVGDFHKNGRFHPNEVSIIKSAELTDFKLYNIKKDVHQDTDISEMEPQIFKKLKKALIALHNDVIIEAPYIQN
ncbi:sulfatase-like hydrolase/transferase [Arenibacter sp. S6351L]|uniref:sulfatase-like hydrolase/transferase n=1 Tax=Arenibacter sp. S6351L TaxID=2926407 RepID=UPI001FF5631A|nr:sulfatase-like hydrolase/transferase [Arenibacter sp. S6351L]MCK0135465.1 sulfatase-like hydrolase/transferase [Arenibacter sp. S6351L]